MSRFVVIWSGQLASVFGSSVSRFALGVWVFQMTGSVMDFALIAICAALPPIALAPVTGFAVDMFGARLCMLVAETASAVITFGAAALLFAGYRDPLVIYGAVLLSSAATAFQRPALLAAIPILVPPGQLGRANGMLELAFGVAEVAGPPVGVALAASAGLGGVVLLDAITFVAALATLCSVRFGASAPRAAGERGAWRELWGGLAVVARRPYLAILLGLTASLNLSLGLVTVLLPPLMLRLESSGALGVVLSVAAAGGLTGGIAMSVWSGPRRKTTGVVAAVALWGAGLVIAGARPSVPLIAAGGFLMMLAQPIYFSSSQVLWQTHVAVALQGRTNALRLALLHIVTLASYLSATALADRLEPLLVPGGALAGTLGPLLGVGPGRGIALLFVCLGAATIAGVLAVAAALRRSFD